MISFRPLIGTGPSPFFGGKDQTPCESRGALGSRPTRSSYISSQGCARHPPMHQALLQDACQCPFLPAWACWCKNFSRQAAFTGFVGLLLISWKVAGRRYHELELRTCPMSDGNITDKVFYNGMAGSIFEAVISFIQPCGWWANLACSNPGWANQNNAINKSIADESVKS